jgi:hypothetical protein
MKNNLLKVFPDILGSDLCHAIYSSFYYVYEESNRRPLQYITAPFHMWRFFVFDTES